MLALLLALSAHAQDTLALRGPVDGPLLVASGTYFFTDFFFDIADDFSTVEVTPTEGPTNSLDAPFVGRTEDARIDSLSDIPGKYMGFGGPLIVGAIGVAMDKDWREGGTWMGIGAEAVLLNYMINDTVKHATRRPRPFTRGDVYQDAIASGTQQPAPDDQLSFYSGHTSTAGAWSFSMAHTLAVTQGWGTGAKIGLYAGATAITGLTGGLRVAAGEHYPTDVLVGGVVGASVGILTTELHRVTPESVRVATGPSGITFSGRW